MIDVPADARLMSFGYKKIFIPQRTRCCKIHLSANDFTEEAFGLLQPSSNCSDMSGLEVEELLTYMQEFRHQVCRKIQNLIDNH